MDRSERILLEVKRVRGNAAIMEELENEEQGVVEDLLLAVADIYVTAIDSHEAEQMVERIFRWVPPDLDEAGCEPEELPSLEDFETAAYQLVQVVVNVFEADGWLDERLDELKQWCMTMLLPARISAGDKKVRKRDRLMLQGQIDAELEHRLRNPSSACRREALAALFAEHCGAAAPPKRSRAARQLGDEEHEAPLDRDDESRARRTRYARWLYEQRGEEEGADETNG